MYSLKMRVEGQNAVHTSDCSMRVTVIWKEHAWTRRVFGIDFALEVFLWES
jgi:hypothetical protein